MKDNGIVAIAFVADQDDEAEFIVDWPREDEDLEQ